MRLPVLSPILHGVLDYAIASALIMFPLLLNLGADSALALWLSVAAGILMIGYSLCTDYPWHISSAIPYDLHLAFNLLAGVSFIVGPFVFGFGMVASIYYMVMGMLVLSIVAISKRWSNSDATDLNIEQVG